MRRLWLSLALLGLIFAATVGNSLYLSSRKSSNRGNHLVCNLYLSKLTISMYHMNASFFFL